MRDPSHWDWQPMRCRKPDCRLPDGHLLIPLGPITGLLALAEELIRHYGIDPYEHPGLLREVEQAIGEEMLDTARAIFRERGIPIPAEQEVISA